MNPNSLSLTDRGNIKNTAYIEMFEQLKARNIDSYCELMWPLPGETLDTLKHGFEQLIDLGARTTVMYPVLLINNARMTGQTSEFGLETRVSDDWKSELKRVHKTKFADRVAVDDGFWFYYSHFLLANCDLNKGLLRFLKQATGKGYAQVIAEFAAYLRDHTATSAYAQLVASIFEKDAHGSLMTIGRLAVHLTHDGRRAAQEDVLGFITTTQLAADVDRALVLSAVWAFTLPRLFAETRDDPDAIVRLLDEWGRGHGRPLSDVAAVQIGSQNIVLEICGAADAWREVVECFIGSAPAHMSRIEIRHLSGHMNYNLKDTNRNFVYAHGMIQRLGHIAARIQTS
jgi:hypothetical protein